MNRSILILNAFIFSSFFGSALMFADNSIVDNRIVENSFADDRFVNGLGRLFFYAATRDQLDQLEQARVQALSEERHPKKNQSPQPKHEDQKRLVSLPKTLYLDGVVARNGRLILSWINGSAVDASEAQSVSLNMTAVEFGDQSHQVIDLRLHGDELLHGQASTTPKLKVGQKWSTREGRALDPVLDQGQRRKRATEQPKGIRVQ